MILFLTIVLVLYTATLLWIWVGQWKLPRTHKLSITPKTGFTIIVPYRNESQNLPGLLQSLLQLSYPSTLFEVYFVNDASEDDSTAIITHYMKEAHFRYSILENQRFSGAPKRCHPSRRKTRELPMDGNNGRRLYSAKGLVGMVRSNHPEQKFKNGLWPRMD